MVTKILYQCDERGVIRVKAPYTCFARVLTTPFPPHGGLGFKQALPGGLLTGRVVQTRDADDKVKNGFIMQLRFEEGLYMADGVKIPDTA